MSVLIRPLVSEKASAGNEKGIYSFVVAKHAGKIEIKKAIVSRYKVHVEAVRTLMMPSKPKVRYTRTRVTRGRKRGYKKAIVVLKQGDMIDFYASV